MWELYSIESFDLLGLIPEFIYGGDPSPVKEQIARNYAHGGGYKSMDGWRFNPYTKTIKYPGDAPLEPIASAKINNELVFVYRHAWVAIIQEDGAFAVTRMD